MTIAFPIARIPLAQQDPIEVAAAGVRSAVNDFITETNAASTANRVHQIRNLINALTVELATAEMVALDRADRLCGYYKEQTQHAC